MSDRLATVATFGCPVEANLARNRLEAAGIKAFLADEETVGMVWHLTNALGGIKLQVGDRDAEEALAILAESEAPDLPAPAKPMKHYRRRAGGATIGNRHGGGGRAGIGTYQQGTECRPRPTGCRAGPLAPTSTTVRLLAASESVRFG